VLESLVREYVLSHCGCRLPGDPVRAPLVVAGARHHGVHRCPSAPDVYHLRTGSCPPGLSARLADTFRAAADYRWAATGLIVGLAYWSAPLIQEFAARPGNLTALVRGQGAPGSKAGAAFGLKALAASAQPPPFWWMPDEPPMRLSLIGGRSDVAGVVVLVLAFMVLAAACSLRSRHAVALAAVSLMVTVTTMIMYSHIPKASIAITTPTANNLRYLMAPMFAVGVLSWLAPGVVLVLAGRRAAGRVPSVATPRGDGTAIGASRIMAASWAVRIIGPSAVAIIGLASFVGVEAVDSPIFQSPAMRDVSAAFQQIERDMSSRQIMLSVAGHDKSIRRQVTFGLAYALQAVGYRPEVMTMWALDLGSIYVFRRKPMTQVTVLMRGRDLSVAVTHLRPGGRRHLAGGMGRAGLGS
jgi:hypothetical protein